MTPAREWFVTLRIQVARVGVGFAVASLACRAGHDVRARLSSRMVWRRNCRSLDRDVVPDQVDTCPCRGAGGLPRGTIVGRLPSGATVSRTPEELVAKRQRRSIIAGVGSG